MVAGDERVAVSSDDALHIGADGRRRCWWCQGHADYTDYHDVEWGRAVTDDRRLFEKLCLEGFQAGLSWLTILRRRTALRARFFNFDIDRLAALDGAPRDRFVAEALGDADIIRHRGKIEAVLDNARVAQSLIAAHGSFASVIADFTPTDHVRPRTRADIPVTTPSSVALARDLRRAGWRFLGPTSAYAFLQSVGAVNDHIVGCETCPDA
ncbi:MAG: DNA-3-methyladenine glycosylase I [Nitriliruptoraceae bacterium]